MGQSIVLENIPSPVRGSNTTLTWAATNLGRPTRLQVGGQMYTPSATITLTVSGTGANGLDTGTFTYQSLYYVYAIVNQSSLALALVASTSAPSTGPLMPSGYGTAYRAIGLLSGDPAGVSNVFSVTGYSPHISALAGPAGGYDPGIGAWVFGVAGASGSQTSLAIQATQMTGGQNVILGLGSYSPTIIGQYSSGHTLIVNNVYSGSLAADNFLKKSTAFGSNMIDMGLADADASFSFRYAPQAVTSPQASKNGMWTTNLGTVSTTGVWNLPAIYGGQFNGTTGYIGGFFDGPGSGNTSLDTTRGIGPAFLMRSIPGGGVSVAGNLCGLSWANNGTGNYTDTGLVAILAGNTQTIQVVLFVGWMNNNQGTGTTQPTNPIILNFATKTSTVTSTGVFQAATLIWQWVNVSGSSYKLQAQASALAGATSVAMAGFAFVLGGGN